MKTHVFQNKDQIFEFDPQELVVKNILNHNTQYQTESEDKHSEENIVTSISINIAQRCNLNCTYCYADQGTYGNSSEITLQTAKESIDWLIAQARNKRELAVNFFGGEPLLQFVTLKNLVYYIEEVSAKNNLKFHYSITTNGTLLNEKVISFFKEFDFSVNVSIDGPKILHDKQRPFKNGQSSYDVIVPKLKKLLAAGIHVSGRATITDNTPEAVVIDALKEIGFTHITVTKASDSLFGNSRSVESEEGLSEILLSKEEARRLNWQNLQNEADNFLSKILNKDIDGIRNTKLNPKLYKNIFSLLTGKKRKRFCGAGKNYTGVSSKGDIYLCHRFVGTDAFKLGNVHAQTPKLRTIDDLESELALGVSKCDTCFAKYLCGGGCYHDNLGKTGSIFIQHEEDCRNVRKIAEIAIALVARLSESDKTFLVENNVVAIKFCPLDL